MKILTCLISIPESRFMWSRNQSNLTRWFLERDVSWPDFCFFIISIRTSLSSKMRRDTRKQEVWTSGENWTVLSVKLISFMGGSVHWAWYCAANFCLWKLWDIYHQLRKNGRTLNLHFIRQLFVSKFNGFVDNTCHVIYSSKLGVLTMRPTLKNFKTIRWQNLDMEKRILHERSHFFKVSIPNNKCESKWRLMSITVKAKRTTTRIRMTRTRGKERERQSFGSRQNSERESSKQYSLCEKVSFTSKVK